MTDSIFPIDHESVNPDQQVGKCECGCGLNTLINNVTKRPRRFLLGHNLKSPDHHPLKRRPFADRFWDKVKKSDGCWEWQGYRHDDNYGIIRRDGKFAIAHRVAYELTKGSIPPGLIVRHRCDNPPCCNPDHLILGTTLDNALDAQERGRLRKWSGITAEDVRHIRKMYASGEKTRKELIKMYGFTASCLRDILIRHTWKHVD